MKSTLGNSKARKPADRPERATYTVDELALVLNRNRVGIYADLAAGLIPHRRLGKRYIISRTAIHRWLEGTDSQDSAA